MQYLCPKCGNFMVIVSTASISIPAIIFYYCRNCGYISKPENKKPIYMTLPKELWSDEDKKDEI